MIEFAFAITILLVFFMATVTFSFLFSDYYSAQKVAREGAREASITGEEDVARTKAMQAAWLWGLDPDRVSVNFSQNGTAVTCSVGYTSIPFSKTFPTLVNGNLLQEFTINTRATFVWLDSQ
ncbi:MAG: TadE family protein [Bacillota bacterium]